MDIRVSVIGAGSWGTTVAALAAHNAPTVLWSRRATLAEQIDTEHENGDYLAGYRLPTQLRATADLEEAVTRLVRALELVPGPRALVGHGVGVDARARVGHGPPSLAVGLELAGNKFDVAYQYHNADGSHFDAKGNPIGYFRQLDGFFHVIFGHDAGCGDDHRCTQGLDINLSFQGIGGGITNSG